MSKRAGMDPYLRVIQAFNRAGVRYVVVGMSGINYYATRPSEAFGTMDYDVFLKPTMPNVQKAIRQLQDMEFTLGTAQGPIGLDDLRMVIRTQRTIVATTADGLMVELLLAISGYTFEALVEDAMAIIVRGTPITVGRLEKLLRSKQIAGRPKDREFLKRYGMLLGEGSPHGYGPKFKKSLEESYREYRRKGGIPLEKLRAKFSR